MARSGLVCASFVGALRPLLVPTIEYLSSSAAIATTRIIISMRGTNYRDFTQVYFGSSQINPQFISSSHLVFYVPDDLPSGTYTIYVANDNLVSNSVEFTLDEMPGYWELDESNFSLTNKNNGDINMKTSYVISKIGYADNIPAGKFIIQDGGQRTELPIFISIPNLENYFNFDGSNKDVVISIGTPMTINVSDTISSDIIVIIYPGHQITIIDKNNKEILNVENNSLNPVMASPYNSGSKMKALVVKRKINKKWNTI